MKRIISTFLMITLLISFSTFNISATADDESSYGNEIKFLEKLGIIGEDFDSTSNISRAEFATMTVKLLHPDLDLSSIGDFKGNAFADVLTNHDYYSYIKACKDLKIISGNELSYFYPDNNITKIDAVTMLINALGYTQYAQAKGGYTTGYYYVADQIGILKGIKTIGSGEAKGGVIAKLIYNALFADMVFYESISSNNVKVKIESGKNILSERMGIKEYDSIVVDNGITSLADDTMGNIDSVVISEYATGNSITAFVNDSDIGSCLGLRVNVLIKSDKESGRNEVIFYSKNQNLEEKTINCDKVINVTDSYIEYEDKNSSSGKFEKISFESDVPTVLFNGVHITKYDNNIFKPKDGVLYCIDNNNDGKFEIVSIFNFNYKSGNYNAPTRNVVVKGFDKKNLYISDWFDSNADLNLKKDEYIFQFALNENRKSFDDFYEFDVISIAEVPQLVDNKTFYYLVVSDKKANGTISLGINEIIVNNEYYPVSDSILNTKPNYLKNLDYTKELKACLDITGKVAYVHGLTSTSGKKYGFVESYGKTTDFEPVGLIKMFTLDNKLETFQFAEKVSMNEEKQTFVSLNDIFDNLANNDSNLIVYELNSSNQINNIKFCKESDEAFNKDDEGFNLNYTMTSEKHAHKSLDGVGIFDTFFFNIYTSESTGKVLENYCSVKYNGFIEGGAYNKVRFYDIGVAGVAKAALLLTKIQDGGNVVGAWASDHSFPCVFKNMTQAVGPDGEIVNKVYFYEAGVLKGLNLANSLGDVGLTGLYYDIRKLSLGDLFVYETDVSGQIRTYSTYYVSEAQSTTQGVLYTNTEELYAGHLVIKGTLAYKSSNIISIGYSMSGKTMHYPTDAKGGLKVYLINKEKGKITLSSIDEIKAGYEKNEPGANVVAFVRLEQLNELFVYE